jgi:uncharacterized protein
VDAFAVFGDNQWIRASATREASTTMARIERPTHAAILGYLQRHLPGLMAVYLFGSRASGDHRRSSDFDLAVLGERPLSPGQRFDLAQELASLLDGDVDLIDLRAASTVLRSQVIGSGRPLFRADTPEVEQFEDFVYSDYARLNEERAAILADIRERGSIHGR